MNIFVGGVYGVGKTYLCELLAKRLSIPHFSASQVIQHSKVDKSVKNVDLNQQRLISGVAEINQEHPRILLDGHFVIHSEDGSVKIPSSVFGHLNLERVLVLTQDANVILQRLKGRKGQLFDESYIKSLQEEEVNHGSEVASSLKIPFNSPLSSTQSLPGIVSFINGQ